MKIIAVEEKDLQEVLTLQFLAFQKDAIALNNMNIPPLRQTLEDVTDDFRRCTFLKAIDDNNNIIGSVRATINNEVAHIGKLIVHPNYQGIGIGTKLLLEIERLHPNKIYELFTNAKNQSNINFYLAKGYKKVEEKTFPDGICLLYMRKLINVAY